MSVQTSPQPAAPPSPERRSAVDVFNARARASAHRVALRHKERDAWKPTTWGEWARAAQEIAGGLIELGVAPTDRVAILSSTRREWVLCDIGILTAGAVVVPIYASNLPDQCEYILRDAGAVVAIAEDEQQLDKLVAVRAAVPAVKKVVLMSGAPRATSDWVMTLDELRASGARWLSANPKRLDDIAAAIDPTGAATFIYTSGTTGPPKGVVLTHANLVFTCHVVEDLLELGEGDEQLLFLPLAHSFARVVEWAFIAIGASTAFAQNMNTLVADMAEVRPTLVAAVPRVFEKAYARIQASFAEKRKSPVGRRIIDWALAVGRERSRRLRAREQVDGLRFRIADKLVFSKVRQIFGGRIRFFISGGAPLSAEIAEFFHAAGLLILEGYALTETTAAGTVNRPDSYEFGTVGKPLPGVEVQIAPDGEILLRGGSVMQGYWKQPQATAEAIDGDGWFHTGDIGRIEPSGNLRITDRKKDIIVTAGGKNIAPQNLENELKAACPLISQVVVIGDRQKYLVALITLGEDAARDRPGAEAAVREAVDRVNRKLASYETIKRFTILPRDLTEEAGELTPSLKVKRKVVSDRYREEIASMYAEPA
ncbi:MAG TPA: long-chain fatty acid--CoA ligase [Kofleriaceae bacterium]|nr:long-chain fatty acid--CoA ligase [Kofleriaceae bacterium]